MVPCRAALKIHRLFREGNQQSDGALEGFRVGIGIATRRAIAGRIGTQDHAKIGVFGPVVIISSRLEGLTKCTGVSILMDEATAAVVRADLETTEGRCRSVGNLLPAGFSDAVQVSQLLPSEDPSPISKRISKRTKPH